jgi:hypothetical protein
MANPRFYWHPSSTGTLEYIDLGENIRDIQEDPEERLVGAESLDGRVHTTFFGSRLRVRIIHERFTSASVARKLMSMQAHLAKGGTVGFARDPDKAWAGYSRTNRPRGTTSIVTEGNTWSYNTSAALANGDEVCISSGAPECHREWTTVAAAVTGTRVTLASPGLLHDYANGWAFIRHRDFFPALCVPAGQSLGAIVTHEKRLAYTLDLTLVENVAAIARMSEVGSGIIAGGTSSGRTQTLQQLAKHPRAFTLGRTRG